MLAARGTGLQHQVSATVGFADAAVSAREAMLEALGPSVTPLKQLTLVLAYTLTDPDGRNPNWAAFSYAGPPVVEPPSEAPLRLTDIDAEVDELQADVCVVGFGAAGGVIAAELAKRGLHVVVLEAGHLLHAR